MGFVEESLNVVECPVPGKDRLEAGDVVTAVAQRRLVEREQPDARDAEPLEVVEFLGQPGEVTRAVTVAVEERIHGDLVEDGVDKPGCAHNGRLLRPVGSDGCDDCGAAWEALRSGTTGEG